MALLSGQLDDSSIVDVIRSIYLRGASGVLTIERSDSRRRFSFVDGELFLPDSHALAQRLSDLLEAQQSLEEVPFYRKVIAQSRGEDPNGFGPNWSNVDDFDIPTVLRKQMD